jgi:hypothetical protein
MRADDADTACRRSVALYDSYQIEPRIPLDADCN